MRGPRRGRDWTDERCDEGASEEGSRDLKAPWARERQRAISAVARFTRRGASEAHDPWHDQVRAIVAANGGEAALARYHAGLERLVRERTSAVVIQSEEGAVEDTYRKLLDSLS